MACANVRDRFRTIGDDIAFFRFSAAGGELLNIARFDDLGLEPRDRFGSSAKVLGLLRRMM
jgi:hypothetical protein